MNQSDAIKDAEQCATFFRTLLAEGVPISQAAYMAAEYGKSLVIARAAQEKPKEPWQDDQR